MKIYKHLRGLVKKLLARSGLNYEPNGKPPSSTIELMDIVVFINIALKTNFHGMTLVQIGASDGVTHDFVNPITKQFNINAFLVEPMPLQFEKLKKNYEGISSAKCINAAISETNGYCTMYRVRPDGKMKNSYFVDTLASRDHRHLIKHRIPIEEIEEIEVPCLTLEKLYSQQSINRVDILVVDAEGFDARIITSAISLKEMPNYIIFENIHISKTDKTDLYNLLDTKGYRYIHGLRDTLAVKGEILDESITEVDFA